MLNQALLGAVSRRISQFWKPANGYLFLGTQSRDSANPSDFFLTRLEDIRYMGDDDGATGLFRDGLKALGTFFLVILITRHISEEISGRKVEAFIRR